MALMLTTGLSELIAVSRGPAPRKPHHHWMSYIRHEDYIENGIASPLIGYYMSPLDGTFSESGHTWFFAFCDDDANHVAHDDGFIFPPGFYLAKKQVIGSQCYLHYLGTYKINGDDHKFAGWSMGEGDVGNRLELIDDEGDYDPPLYQMDL